MLTGPSRDSIEVSVVIPTRKRPELVVRALRSALSQTFRGSFEVLVVIDGEDGETRPALDQVSDDRLRVVDLAIRVGGSEARNVGVRVARGRWIALLDDDDEWLPPKISRQIEAAHNSPAPYPVIASRLIARTPEGDWARPLRAYNGSQPVSEYLFRRRSLADGAYALQTSTLLVPRHLLLSVPFREGLPRHQDWDWALRAERTPGVTFTVLDEPLTIYHVEDGRPGAGRSTDWTFSLEWGRSVRDSMTPRSYGWFLASECCSRAAKSGAPLNVRITIVQEYFLHARPTLRSLVMVIFFLAIPGFVRRRIRARFRARRVPASRANAITLFSGRSRRGTRRTEA